MSASLDENPNFAISLFQQFFLTVMKLWLNLTDQDLAYHFGVNQSTISRNFPKMDRHNVSARADDSVAMCVCVRECVCV